MGPPPHEPPTCRCDECDLVMDFDDMPDSYFAFLSNQKKLAEPDKINGAMKELGRGSEAPQGAKGKVRSRASQPNLRRVRHQAERAVAAVDPAHQHAARQLDITQRHRACRSGKSGHPSSNRRLRAASRPAIRGSAPKPPSSPANREHVDADARPSGPAVAAPVRAMRSCSYSWACWLPRSSCSLTSSSTK